MKKVKLKVKLADGKTRLFQHINSTIFIGLNGRPVSAIQFIEELYGELPALFKSEDELKALWSKPDTRRALLAELEEKGFEEEKLRTLRKLINAEKSDLYDVLAYIAFAIGTMTREERVGHF